MHFRALLTAPFALFVGLTTFASCSSDPPASPDAGCTTCGCEQGKLDCNLDPSDGCEVDLNTDQENCGVCGVVCPDSACENGKCLASGCGIDNKYDCDKDTSNGCETDLGVDAKNCGHCGRACANGKTCATRVCTEDTVAKALTEPFGIGLTTTQVFFTTKDGKVGKVDKSGGTPTFLSTGHSFPRALVLDATYIYWVNEGNADAAGQVLRMKQDGTCTPATPCPQILSDKQAKPRALAFDGTDVYWINTAKGLGDASIAKVSSAGGATTTLATKLDRPFAIKTDGDFVYYTIENEGVFRMKKDGTGVEKLIAGTGCKGFLIDGNDLIYTSNARIYKIPKAGAKSPTQVVGVASPVAVVADATHVYFSVYNEVRRASRDGICSGGPCAQPIGMGKVTGIVDDVSNLAVDEKYIYWTNVYGSSIARVEK